MSERLRTQAVRVGGCVIARAVVRNVEKGAGVPVRARRGMILESAVLNIKPGEEADFEGAFGEAKGIIAGMRGFNGLELQRCVENRSRYLLLVRWPRSRITRWVSGGRTSTSGGRRSCTTSTTRSRRSSTTRLFMLHRRIVQLRVPERKPRTRQLQRGVTRS
jgi:heme-degrading monooxygenase HmoA